MLRRVPSTGVALTGTGYPRRSPTFSWTAPVVGCAPTARFEVAVGVAAPDDVVGGCRFLLDGNLGGVFFGTVRS